MNHCSMKCLSHAIYEEQIDLTASFEWSAEKLKLDYQLEFDPKQVEIDISGSELTTSTRQDELWQKTCFECFFKSSLVDEYWEINLSPAGAWNIYHFDRYRDGMKQADWIESLVLKSHTFDGCVGGYEYEEINAGCIMHQISTVIDVAPLKLDAAQLEFNLTVVLKLDGQLTYWAIDGSNQKPDFHDVRYFRRYEQQS